MPARLPTCRPTACPSAVGPPRCEQGARDSCRLVGRPASANGLPAPVGDATPVSAGRSITPATSRSSTTAPSNGDAPPLLDDGREPERSHEQGDEQDAAVRSGKSCFKRTRITVYDVLEYLGGGMTEEQILGDFPDLTRDDIRAALAFAAARERRVTNQWREAAFRRERESYARGHPAPRVSRFLSRPRSRSASTRDHPRCCHR
jgi:uncharacterized protein (DUF433 family)